MVDRSQLRVGNGGGYWGDNLDAPYEKAQRTRTAEKAMITE